VDGRAGRYPRDGTRVAAPRWAYTAGVVPQHAGDEDAVIPRAQVLAERQAQLDARDARADQREVDLEAEASAANLRDLAADVRERGLDARESAADRRDRQSDRRDAAALDRARAADERDHLAALRETAAENRERAADQREIDAELAQDWPPQ